MRRFHVPAHREEYDAEYRRGPTDSTSDNHIPWSDEEDDHTHSSQAGGANTKWFKYIGILLIFTFVLFVFIPGRSTDTQTSDWAISQKHTLAAARRKNPNFVDRSDAGSGDNQETEIKPEFLNTMESPKRKRDVSLSTPPSNNEIPQVTRVTDLEVQSLLNDDDTDELLTHDQPIDPNQNVDDSQDNQDDPVEIPQELPDDNSTNDSGSSSDEVVLTEDPVIKSLTDDTSNENSNKNDNELNVVGKDDKNLKEYIEMEKIKARLEIIDQIKQTVEKAKESGDIEMEKQELTKEMEGLASQRLTDEQIDDVVERLMSADDPRYHDVLDTTFNLLKTPDMPSADKALILGDLARVFARHSLDTELRPSKQDNGEVKLFLLEDDDNDNDGMIRKRKSLGIPMDQVKALASQPAPRSSFGTADALPDETKSSTPSEFSSHDINSLYDDLNVDLLDATVQKNLKTALKSSLKDENIVSIKPVAGENETRVSLDDRYDHLPLTNDPSKESADSLDTKDHLQAEGKFREEDKVIKPNKNNDSETVGYTGDQIHDPVYHETSGSFADHEAEDSDSLIDKLDHLIHEDPDTGVLSDDVPISLNQTETESSGKTGFLEA
eukprot:CAMPEP_0115037266 /NCGR_PEP_ID=MMETSP0216-20121206/42683_1 /TAXON_ID=223996 /ORGANISM="Protocruzia adherens, Strain Boccale" /LENGTH=608 /DNA_ID=CAMNT_0002417387 /DNA_START=98 /DNA_END=1924 /DNA_ORIENTATION=-